ncbi:hypothetical protein ZIOFF_050743 [Zingiber officinale]|uniref:DEAD/DEAH-box helicase domain-containing protein n=1 Tax=Zingiber officinale TaxID=94328 RepID=A0A8J5G129_ZINOF|nr:hypothetical protein ZIOFF_050743 [Zingiber officinale]
MNLCHPLTWLKKVNNSQKIEYSCRENRSSKVIYDSHYRSHPRDDTLNCGNFSKNDEVSFGPRQPFVTETVMPQTSSRMIVNTNEVVCDSVDNLANDIFLDALDDDELLQAPFTPVSRSYIGCPREDALPLKLITVSTELLDNASELSPEHCKNLNQERLHLKNKIQHLEKDLSLSNQDEERQRSSFTASTTTSRNFQLERPSSMTDPVNFNSQAYIRNEPGDTMTWSSPTPSCYANQFGTTSAERQVFTPKLLDINYIEGSGDKKWKSLDFPWTKKLEANNRKVFGNHSFHPNQREVINATMSGCDVFVLMPTGGGKSLTYQANIPATYLGANIEWAEQQDIFREVMSDVCKYKLQYVTPEKIANGQSMVTSKVGKCYAFTGFEALKELFLLSGWHRGGNSDGEQHTEESAGELGLRWRCVARKLGLGGDSGISVVRR